MKLRFVDCVFDPDTREVVRAGRALAISPKAFALLELLIECRPRAVDRAQMHSRLWPDVHVSEANLANLVVELRAAFGDDAHEPAVIRTVPRFGYAFRAETRAAKEAPRPPRPPEAAYRLIWGRREIALDPGENLIGRDRDAVVWIDDESVSRRHARIRIDGDGAALEDLGSKNGTYLHGKRLDGEATLRDRDRLKIGPASLELRVLRRTGSTLSSLPRRSPR